MTANNNMVNFAQHDAMIREFAQLLLWANHSGSDEITASIKNTLARTIAAYIRAAQVTDPALTQAFFNSAVGFVERILLQDEKENGSPE